MALVSLDPAKAQKMAKLLTKYKALCSEQLRVSGSLRVDSCPEALKQRLTANPYIYNKEPGEVTAPGELIPIVKEFKAYFDSIKNKFKKDFDERKLLELLEKRDSGNLAADVVFLRGNDYLNKEKLMESLHAQVMENLKRGSGPILASGMAEYTPKKDTLFSEVFDRADKEMYKNKRKLKKEESNL